MIGTQHKAARSVLRGLAPPYVSELLATRSGALTTLGAFPTARYLQLPGGEVIAVLSADAVALPIGIVLDRPASALRLDTLDAAFSIESGLLHWDRSPIELTGDRDTMLRFAGEPNPAAVAWCRRRLDHSVSADDLAAASLLSTAPDAAVARLLGGGPGLTPAGDDLLCGALAGTRLFGRVAVPLVRIVRRQLAERPRATTALSRQLLLQACDAAGVPQLQRLADSLCGPASAGSSELHRSFGALSAIGHSSGPALAAGLLASLALPSSVPEASRDHPSADRELEVAGSRM